MAAPTKASDIDLSPIPGKRYFNVVREWREEFIYFLMIDRFHDDQARSPVLQSNRQNGISTPDDFFGGTIQGITNQPRLHRRARLHRHLALADLREQCKGVSRLQHQQLPERRSALRHGAGPDRPGRSGS